jgi:CheY-like chemotaxis protein
MRHDSQDGEDGYDTVQEIRADESWRELPVIAVTAHAMVGDDRRCVAAGCSDYMAKPFRLAQLREMLRRHLPPSLWPGAGD